MSRASSLTLCAVVAMAIGACSSSSGQPVQSSGDSGTPDTSTCGLDCGPVDAAVDVAPYDTGWVCPLIPETNVGSTCDACIQSSCDSLWCTCAQSEVVVDAGPNGCLAAVACNASGADAGSADAGCVGVFSQADAQQAQMLLSCITQSCATACAGLVTLEI
jgi:hypothetical protein